MIKILSFSNLFVLLSVFCVAAIAAPRQELPPKLGYVPVYIREGDTPLSLINPKLVKAFHEDEEQQKIPKAIDVANGNERNQATKNMKADEESNDKTAEVNDTKDTSKEQQKFYEDVEKQEQKISASDIAEFTIDDIKAFAHDSQVNKTK